MKIIFISSSLEPGRDGAGDQIRTLAAEMIKKGHECAILALYDKLTEKEFNDYQETLDIRVKTLRLPSIWATDKRFDRAKIWIDEFNPDWISLHYVCFGFNKYGLPMEMITSFRKIIGDAKLNIMFWELWCGMNNSAKNYKEKILGFLQKIHLKVMVMALKPDSIFASTDYYIRHLKKIGIASSLVPVIGNIPTGYFGSEKEWNEVTNNLGLIHLKNKDEWLIVGFFGSFYPCKGLKELIEDTTKAAKQLNKTLCIITIGKSRQNSTEEMIKEMPDIKYIKTGVLEPEMVNRVMQLVDMGIVTSSANGITKSSSAISWMERGIPILISKKDKTYLQEQMEPEGIFQINSDKDIIKVHALSIPVKNPIDEVLKHYSSLEYVN
ncbi:hypothetical protein AB6735_00105 [Mucilaginibacter sp. RCC_168]|uniref:hypothetical protein n=1 Tax=Mucilaginibacter sp. RCC_168 TaxID=3239221 RepID=UPI0035260D74